MSAEGMRGIGPLGWKRVAARDEEDDDDDKR